MTGVPLDVQPVFSPGDADPSVGVVSVFDPQDLDVDSVTIGEVSPTAGKAAMDWVTLAAHMAMDARVDAITTAPLNKEAAALGGYHDIGHTELFQRIAGASQVATMLMTGPLRVVHLTTHRSLRRACDYVKKSYILTRLQLIDVTFEEWVMPHPRIAVAALNPHGSDAGLLGDEEENEISPAVDEAIQVGIDAIGPVPADTVFVQAINGAYDVVLAMYHDQGHIPIKVHGLERSISVNLGLPFIRTSVDHGTAFDIAGAGIANPRSMIEALKAAVSLATGKGLP
jgi:4-hydroxythreonine-4-phosphate dehydrogenase